MGRDVSVCVCANSGRRWASSLWLHVACRACPDRGQTWSHQVMSKPMELGSGDGEEMEGEVSLEGRRGESGICFRSISLILGEPCEGLLLTLSWRYFLSFLGVRLGAGKSQWLPSSLCNQTPSFEAQPCWFLARFSPLQLRAQFFYLWCSSSNLSDLWDYKLFVPQFSHL